LRHLLTRILQGKILQLSFSWIILRVTLFELAPGFFFCGEFSPPGDNKKRAGEFNKGIFENFYKKFAISREQKG
jgi:hypothetical protein